MDPSQIQEDTANDIHSLENTDGTTDSPAAIDATGGQAVPATTPQAAAPTPKASGFKRLWKRFNLYLLLFVFMILLAVGAFVYLTIKSKQADQTTPKSQGLSQDALKTLANSDVTVGDAKQVLNVQSNAIFAGSVLVRSSLEVAGQLKVGGKLSISDLEVSGATQLSDVQAHNLTVSGALNLQGALTIKNGLSVSGNSNFTGNVTTASLTTGALQLNGDLNLTHHVIAGGTIPAATRGTAVGGGGTISLTGSDTAGSIQINTGTAPPAGCFVSVTFSQKFTSTPHVIVTPIGSFAAGLNYYVDRSTTGFSICALLSAAGSQTFGFDYIVLD